MNIKQNWVGMQPLGDKMVQITLCLLMDNRFNGGYHFARFLDWSMELELWNGMER